ncbi:hypothetical protein ACGFY3_23500 [Streptomyces mirabilis]|uniref:hypothetical protein n=1 Tax=Streptomyces TaxID=1883 RepID=UPI0033A0198B
MQAENNTREPERPDQNHQRQKKASKRCRHGRPPVDWLLRSLRGSLARLFEQDG